MSGNDTKYTYVFKVPFAGEAGVGKTCLFRRYTEGTFDDTYNHTIGLDFGRKIMKVDGEDVDMTLWDTAGQERFRSVIRCYYRGAHGVILVYDVTKKESFDNAREWLNKVVTWTDGKASILLIGNKCDLHAEREVDYATAKDFADQHGLLLIETSAKDTTNVEQSLAKLAVEIKNKVDATVANDRRHKLKLDTQTKQNVCC